MNKIIELKNYKNKKNGCSSVKNIDSYKKDGKKYESAYDKALKNMTAEDYKMIEELFEN